MGAFQTDLSFFRASGINGKTVAATLLGTTENGTQTFFPLFTVTYLSAATLATVVGVASIGTNSPNYNDIVTALTLTGVTAANKMITTFLTAATVGIPANTAIYLNISTGWVATSATITQEIWGMYR